LGLTVLATKHSVSKPGRFFVFLTPFFHFFFFAGIAFRQLKSHTLLSGILAPRLTTVNPQGYKAWFALSNPVREQLRFESLALADAETVKLDCTYFCVPIDYLACTRSRTFFQLHGSLVLKVEKADF
jgi:hypothetical protein